MKILWCDIKTNNNYRFINKISIKRIANIRMSLVKFSVLTQKFNPHLQTCIV
uniref:Uncharacterized protein n=1 Tax=Ciona intestinalis TaxID=7719 RepID=H2Y1P5_CIOIN